MESKVRSVILLVLLTLFSSWSVREPARAQAPLPTLVDQNLIVRTVVAGLDQPTTMAFIGSNDFFVLEKATGMVKRVTNGVVVGTVLDLAVNNSSERGLLGIALHPDFNVNRLVYLYWTCVSPPAGSQFNTDSTCPNTPATGADSANLLASPYLGNRVDRFVWDGAALRFERNLIKLRSFQHDQSNGVARGNHNGGVIKFGGDRKLYIIFGDNGRRGEMQNLADGPVGRGVADDQFGGPFADNGHFTGVIIRLNDDGSTPADNPFFAAGAQMGGEGGANVQRTFAYGVRNSFGMAFDPQSGELWYQDNGDDSFDEINRVERGSNLGWLQVMGPIDRIGEFRAIETTFAPGDLQQQRWPPSRIGTAAEARARLFMLPGAVYRDPVFSWRWALAPAGIGFLSGNALGADYAGDLFVGASRLTLQDGYLFRLNLTADRRSVAVDDARLNDRVADNNAKFDITESESLRFGAGFGVGTDIVTGPNGNLFVVSLSNGVVYEISRR
jgi:glucose/arabinose dehydrogenase